MEILGVYRETAAVVKVGKANRIELIKTADVNELYNPDLVVATALSSSAVLFRRFLMPLTRRGQILSALPFQIESLLPQGEEEIVSIPLIKKRGRKESIISLFASTKGQINSLEKFSAEWIGWAPFALVDLMRWSHPDRKEALLLYISREESFAVYVKEGEIDSSFPLKGWTAPELDRLISVVNQKKGMSESCPILLFGAAAEDPLTVAAIEKGCAPHPILENGSLRRHAIAIGIGIGALTKEGVNFAQGPFISPATLKRKRKVIFSYLFFSLSLSTLLLGADLLYRYIKNNQLRDTLSIESKGESIKTQISELENQFSQKKKSVQLIPTARTVSDLLAHLSLEKPGIEIQKIHYVASASQAQVELEFTATDPKAADALLSTLSPPIQVSNQGNRYKVTLEHFR